MKQSKRQAKKQQDKIDYIELLKRDGFDQKQIIYFFECKKVTDVLLASNKTLIVVVAILCSALLFIGLSNIKMLT